MPVDFSFGKTGLALDLPAGPQYQILEARWARPLEDPRGALEAALDAPIGCPPLEEFARGRRSAAISVCDITRPAPNRMTLPPIFQRLEAAGITKQNTTILIATGLHRPATETEITEILGPEVAAAGYTVVNHNARAQEDHLFLGETSTGTPVWIDRRFVEADFHLTLGFIEPHLMLGFSGARKLVAPGLAYQTTIKTLHSPRFMRDPRAVENSIEDNPLHRELWEISALAGHDFALDVVLAKGKKIAHVFAGSPRAAHDRGIACVRQVLLEELGAPVDAVITTSAGYPLDLTFYQAVKGLTAASHIVKPGGVILLLAECSEGSGAREFSEMLRTWKNPEAFLAHIEHDEVTVDQWQLEKLALVVRHCEVWFYTPGLPPEYHPSVWGRIFGNAEDAVRALAARVGAGAQVAVIPEGPYVLARTRETSGSLSKSSLA